MSDSPARGRLARKDRAEKIALFRYQLIREAADETVTSRQRGPMVRALAAAEHAGPFGGTVRVSKDTIDRWIRVWRRDGFDGLKPKDRAQGPATPVHILSLAATLKLERPNRTAAQVKRIMTETLGEAPSESTLLRHFRSLDIPTGVAAQATGRFEAIRPNEIWVGDGLHGPKINGRKTYLFAFLDDHSRLVTAARWAYAEDAVRLSAALRPALGAHGVPEAIYVDNGSAFIDASLARICARLGIRLIHSKPYRPQGRGKIERFFNTVTSQFLGEITITDTPAAATSNGATDTTAAAGTAETEAAGTAISGLEELNALFTSWVQMVYQRTVHSTTGQTPLQRWDTGWNNHKPDRRNPDVIAEAFRWSAQRKVTKTATVSLHGNTYQVDPLLAGATVELIYDPFDLTGPIAVTAAGEVPAGQAVLLDICRHVHPKALNAVNDADRGAKNTASGIDYLRLVENRHKDTMTGTPISFNKIAKNTTTDREVHQ